MNFDTLFLDRDGILNRKIDDGYVLSISDVELMPGMREFLLWAKDNFKQLVVVTNQRCIGRNLVSEQEVKVINDFINKQLGNHISAFYVCPHLTEESCNCRKPKQGLFLAVAKDFRVEFEHSWMVGDSETDLIPAKQLGIQTIYISNRSSKYADVAVIATDEIQEIFLKIVAGAIPVDTFTG